MRLRPWLLSIAATVCALLALGSAPALAGAAPAVATGRSAPACPTDIHAQKQQFRAVWIASVANIDWPSRPGLTPEQQKAELRGWYDMAVAQNHNAVVVQVRPTATPSGPARSSPGRSTSPEPRATTPATTRSPSRSRRRTSATSSSTPGSTPTASR